MIDLRHNQRPPHRLASIGGVNAREGAMVPSVTGRPDGCLFEGCDRPVLARRMCSTHYGQARRGKALTPIQQREGARLCSFEGCGRRHSSKGFCAAHRRQQREGKTLTPIFVYRGTRPCSFNGCANIAKVRGLCNGHYGQLKLGKTLAPLRVPGKMCAFEGCTHRTASFGLCYSHRRQANKGQELRYLGAYADSRGAWQTNPSGYVIRFVTKANGKQVGILQHREVMEGIIGRRLRRSENVHHINGFRDDNRPENLELWSTAQPAGQRVADKVTWAIEVLKLYAPERLATEERPSLTLIEGGALNNIAKTERMQATIGIAA